MTLLRKLGAALLAACLVLPATAANVLLIEDQVGFGNAGTVLAGDGHNVTELTNEFDNAYANLQDLAFLQGFDIVVWGARGDGFGEETPAGVLSTLESYIQAGGNLLVTGYDTLGSPEDTGLANLVRSSTSGDRVSGDDEWVTANIDNFILNGPYGDFRNLSFTATGYDDDNLTAGPGAVALVTYTPGDRIIFADLPAPGGSVGYWNGGLSGTSDNAQPDFSDGAQPQNIFRNWVAGVQAVARSEPVAVPVMPLSGIVLLASMVALIVGLRRRRLS